MPEHLPATIVWSVDELILIMAARLKAAYRLQQFQSW